MSFDISFLIPSRQEEFLQNTIDDLREHCSANVEILVGLDGVHKEKPKRADIVYRTDNPLGQRAMVNRLFEMSKGEYVVKLDAHESFAPNFDTDLLKSARKDLIQTPILARLHAFNYVCWLCGRTTRQDEKLDEHTRPVGKSGNHKDVKCEGDFQKKTVWQIEPKPFTKKYVFTPDFVFDYDQNQEGEGLVETMSLQGSFVMMHRETYEKLNPFDEELGSWGASGTEIAIKGWSNGLQVVTNTDTFYAHYFRTEDIPYPRPQSEIDEVYAKVRKLFKPKDIEKIVRKFNFAGGWSEEHITQLYKKP